MLNIFIYLLAIINIVTFFLYGIDKLKAVRGWWRIPEATLLAFSAAFGGFGAILGMLLFRHKIRKPKFFICVPIFVVIQLLFLFKFFLGE